MAEDLDTAELKVVHRRDALDALDHTGCNGSKKEFSRIECVVAPIHVGIKRDLGVLAARDAAMGIQTLRHDVIFKHGTPLAELNNGRR